MHDVVFIGDHRDVALFRDAGIPGYAPPRGLLAERVLAERRRCRILAMTEGTLRALPESLARELREGTAPQLEIVPDLRRGMAPPSFLETLLRRAMRSRAVLPLSA